MASIKIQHSHKNLIFAASVANETGATFEEQGQWIEISHSPELTIPRYCFDQAFDPTGQHPAGQLEGRWRSLLLNKKGYLRYFGDDEVYITDDPPKEKRPQFLLRFPSVETKEETEHWAERAGFGSLTEYINWAIGEANNQWAKQAEAATDQGE